MRSKRYLQYTIHERIHIVGRVLRVCVRVCVCTLGWRRITLLQFPSRARARVLRPGVASSLTRAHVRFVHVPRSLMGLMCAPFCVLRTLRLSLLAPARTGVSDERVMVKLLTTFLLEYVHIQYLCVCVCVCVRSCAHMCVV